MKMILGNGIARIALAAAAALLLMSGALSQAGTILPIGNEQDAWSDMAFPTGITGSYNAGLLTFTAAASPSNDLEIGAEFGPSNLGRHYGVAPSSLGGAFSATLSVSGVQIQADGSVSSGGTLKITHEGSAADSLKDDYANTLHAGPLVIDTDGGSNTTNDGDILLQGSVLEVLLDATGDNTLDVAFAITGGALQNLNPVLGINFAPNNRGILRIAGVTLPSDFSGNFSFNGATINVFGIPEPSSLLMLGLVMFGAALGTRPGRSNVS